MSETRSVRPAGVTDIPLLVELMREFYAESGYPLDTVEASTGFRRLLEDPPRGGVWLVESGGVTAGYAVLTVGFRMEFAGLDAVVDDLFIRPAFRRQGLGRVVLETLVAECRRRGVCAVHLEVGRDNHAAKELYAHFGFRDSARLLMTARL